jgi:probable addiction module antidote protein
MTPEYKFKDFDVLLYEALRDPESAEIYLQDAWEDSTEEFLIALCKYVQANGGMTRCAEKAHLTREALYLMLSGKGNPELRSIRAVLQANGIRFSLTSIPRQPELAAV